VDKTSLHSIEKENKVNPVRAAQNAIRLKFKGLIDSRGYVPTPQDNLLSNVKMSQFEEDLKQGDGDELRMKFCAAHSSSALAINCFAHFKDHLGDLQILGQGNTTFLGFEKRLVIFPNRRPANLDVWIEGPERIVAVESKFLEYLTPKRPEFAPIYDNLKPPFSESCWWEVYKQSKAGTKAFLDSAQLLKHYFGLRRMLEITVDKRKVTLLYLFWEPLNWEQFEAFATHRSEVVKFAHQTESSDISFKWLSYPQLWEKWSKDEDIQVHATNLRERYELSL
jgi:hypothetical protein